VHNTAKQENRDVAKKPRDAACCLYTTPIPPGIK